MSEYTQVKGGWTFSGRKGKGGGSSRAPVETADNLHSTSYARIKLLLSEGEIEGPVDGIKSVFLDDTPLANANGSLNFSGVSVDFREGTDDQTYIPGFPANEQSFSVGVILRSDTPYTRSITNLQLSAVRVTLEFQGLSKANTSNGDISGYSIGYAFDIATDGGAFNQVLTAGVTGKTTSTYSRAHRLDLPPATTGWTIRVRRLTPNADSATIADTTSVSIVSEIIDGKQSHPLWAVAGIQVDASQFASIPAVSVLCKGMKIKVPSNYDPLTRIYSGVWDGTFQTAWTDNPAWVFYDLVTNIRYGLGEMIPSAWVDRYSLYQIAQYCDQLVPDGKGGTEPRFTCNVYLQVQSDAYRVLQDLASVFRGMSFWSTGAIWATADMPKDATFTYTNANVIDGMFTYSGSPRKSRYTSALVSWNDPSDKYRQKVESVDDLDGIIRYGLQETEITAFACTSQGQANRVGKWALKTALKETRPINFSVGLDAMLCSPGQIINVADEGLAGRRIAGRISGRTIEYVTVNGELVVVSEDLVSIESDIDSVPSLTSVTLDSEPVVNGTATITIILPSGVAETRTVESILGKIVTVTEEFSEPPPTDSIWLIETDELVAQKYRVVSVTERDGIIFDIVGLQYSESKFDEIDLNTRVEAAPISIIPSSVQEAPESVTISQFGVMSQGVSSTTMSISCPAVEGAISYDTQWSRDNSDWVIMPATGTAQVEVPNAYNGSYLARMRARNAGGITSAWTTSVLTAIDGALPEPPVVTSLTTTSIIFGIQVDWAIPAVANIVERTEVWYSLTNDRADAIKLGEYAYPQQSTTLLGLRAGQEFFFWVRLVDKNGTIGDWYPDGATTGVHGMASADASDILEYLEDQITETQLATELLTKIDSGGGAAVEIEALQTELAAMYTIKTQLTTGDGRVYLAGIGVGVENNEGIIESQVLIAADRFAVINVDDDEITIPFAIEGGQVVINSALISTATIQEAFVGATLTSLATNPSGDPILSLNFETGEMNMNSASSGARLNFNNDVITVYDETGTLRVKIGNLA